MKLFFLLLLAALPAAAAPKYAPTDGHSAAPLWSDSAYLRKAGAPDYWSLSSYYMPQRKGWSVGAASLSMAFNALYSAGRERGDEEENFDPQRLVELSSAASHGMTLAALAGAARDLLGACGLKGEVLATELPDASARSLETFRAALAANERGPGDVMLLHFTQDTVTGAPGGPFAHISPVGAYDAKTRRVLVLDTDRKWYEPYWAADEQVLKAITAVTPRYGRGGFVVIRKAR